MRHFVFFAILVLGLFLGASYTLNNFVKSANHYIDNAAARAAEIQKEKEAAIPAGKFQLAEPNNKPLTSVEYDSKWDEYYFDYLTESGEKKEFSLPKDKVKFDVTKEKPFIIIEDKQATVFVREYDQIVQVTNTSSTVSPVILPIPFFMGR